MKKLLITLSTGIALLAPACVLADQQWTISDGTLNGVPDHCEVSRTVGSGLWAVDEMTSIDDQSFIIGATTVTYGINGTGYGGDAYLQTLPDAAYVLYGLNVGGVEAYSFFHVVAGNIIDDNCVPDEEDVSLLDHSTHIISMTPFAGESTTSPVTIAAHIYVAPGDVGGLFGHEVRFLMRLVDQNVTMTTAADSTQAPLIFDETIFSPGEYVFNVSTTTLSGNYAVTGIITSAYFNGIISGFPYTRLETNQFIVGTSTFVGALNQTIVSEINAGIASTSATSTAAALGQCNVWFGSISSFLYCTLSLVTPDTGEIKRQGGNLFNAVRYMWPIGYMSRFFDIIDNQTPANISAMPQITITIPAGYPGAGNSFVLTPWDKLFGSNSILATAHSASGSGHTLRDIVEPGWDDFITLLFVLAVVYRVSGIGAMVGHYEAAEAREESRRSRLFNSTITNYNNGRYQRRR